MKTVTGQQMAEIDHYAIERIGIPGIALMEVAALKVLKHIDLDRHKRIAIICGTGNNGGDGCALARGLSARGKDVDVYVMGDPNRGTEDFKTNFFILPRIDIPTYRIETLEEIGRFQDALPQYDLLVDAIFGTGLSSVVRNTQQIVIDTMNESRIYTIAVDVPSGIHATTGQVLGTSVDADEVVCFQFLKQGLFNNPNVRGLIHVEHIGIPQRAIEAVLGPEGGTSVGDLVDFGR